MTRQLLEDTKKPGIARLFRHARRSMRQPLLPVLPGAEGGADACVGLVRARGAANRSPCAGGCGVLSATDAVDAALPFTAAGCADAPLLTAGAGSVGATGAGFDAGAGVGAEIGVGTGAGAKLAVDTLAGTTCCVARVIPSPACGAAAGGAVWGAATAVSTCTETVVAGVSLVATVSLVPGIGGRVGR